MRGKAREILSVRVRHALLWLVAGGTGLVYAWLLLAGLEPAYDRTDTPPPPIRVTFVEPPPAPSPSPAEIEVPALLPQLPIEADPAMDVNEADREPPRPADVELEDMELDQAYAGIDASEGPEATADAEEDPYAELRGRTYREQPGGDVLVLSLLLDRHGHVWNAVIMVPSGNPLADLTRMLSLPGTTLDPIPQIPPGEKRWIDIRFRYPSQTIALP